MRIETDISPKDAFARYAAISRELREKLRDELDRTKLADRQKERRAEEKERREERELEEVVQFVALASETQIAAFTVKLDRYDAATVEALMQNEQELRDVREHIEKMLGQAHQLPDGRRVFKTLDGKRVFDENGNEVSSDMIRPEQIEDGRKRFEPYWQERQHEKMLVQERDDLHEFQRKLDEARDAKDEPSLTKKDLDALEKEIDQAAPDRVRELAGEKPRTNADLPSPRAEAADTSLDSLEVIEVPRRTGPMPGPS